MSAQVANFCKVNKVNREDVETSIRAVKKQYPQYAVKELAEQGQCSLTFILDAEDQRLRCQPFEVCWEDSNTHRETLPALIVQLRAEQHALDLSIVQAAIALYPVLAPAIRNVHLQLPASSHVYEMSRLQGFPLAKLLPVTHAIAPATETKLATLISCFAAFIAKAWSPPSSPSSPSRLVRADSPMSDTTTFLAQCTGKVGSSICDRLELLAKDLPDDELRQYTKQILRCVERMHNWPVALTHGDLIPSNILVNEKTWEITGVVDWAEAEFLPFGICLYGLEHMLGYMDTASDGTRQFVYYATATQMRAWFWQCLLQAVPYLQEKVEDVRVWRDLGVLLWHGIAWDGGKINRVVSEGEDEDDLTRLRAFLGTN